MGRLRPGRRAALLVVAPIALARPVYAQSAPADLKQPAPAASGVLPPEPLEVLEPAYPFDARARGVEASLVLRLTIDAGGRVNEVKVLERSAEGFDGAARAALLGSRFRPAMKGGRPVAAKILFRLEFRPPKDLASAAAASETAKTGGPTTPAATGSAPALPAPPAPTVPGVVVVDSTTNENPGRRPAPSEEVTVAGQRSEAETLERSAAPVTVVDLTRHKQRSSDLGEILARTFGVSVRRAGGLGSDTRFSLNGLQEDQIRFFVNGLPLEHSFPGGIANMPLNLLDRVEIYRGVVPVRYASDALGGAVNIATTESFETRLAGSYELGSFGTRRASLFGRYSEPGGGLALGVEAFLDGAKNDYEVDVEVPDERGRLHPATVERFHDRYRAYGVALDAGVVDVPWARRLILRGMRSAYDKQLQNNIVMSVPYGEVFYGEALDSVQLEYSHTVVSDLEVEARGSYAHDTIHFSDQSQWVYDWYGRRVRERRVAGEIEGEPHDQWIWEKSAFGRVGARYQVADGHRFRLATSSDFTTRTGDEMRQADPGARDPLTAKQDLFKQITGFEYELGLFRRPGELAIKDSDGRVEHLVQNLLFFKSYLYRVDAEEPLPGGVFRERDESRQRFGVGDGVRLLLTDFLFVKASFEITTRLPRADEVFGDGILIHANLDLKPEVSDNANLGARLELEDSPAGDVVLDLNGYLRDTRDQIVLLGNERFYTYQNVYSAVSTGLEGSFEWTFPGRVFACDGSFTWVDLRNQSNQGAFQAYRGDRIPNRPWLYGAFSARLRFTRLFDRRDEIEPFYTARYAHEYYRGWESVGLAQYKQVIPSQLVHGAGVTYTLRRGDAAVWTTLEGQNLTDEVAYDFYGLERPGRAFYMKVTATSR